MSEPEVVGSSVGSAQINTLLVIEREHFNSGDVKGTITGTVRYHFVSNDVRHIDPAQDGAEIVNGVADRVRAELLRNMKLADLLRPSSTTRGR
jgi:hypothetical protein